MSKDPQGSNQKVQIEVSEAKKPLWVQLLPPWVVLAVILLLAFMLIFQGPISELILRTDKVVFGSTTVDLNNPSKTDVEAVLAQIAGGATGARVKYLRNKLEARASELQQMNEGELTVATPAAIFSELIDLVRTTSREIYAVNHRPDVWRSDSSALFDTYEEYLRANQEALKRGVTVHRVIIIPQSRVSDPEMTNILEKHRSAGVDIKYAILEQIRETKAYQDMFSKFNSRNFGLALTETNIAMYDKEVIVHTLAVGPDTARSPTRLRITWRAADIEAFSPEILFNAPMVRDFRGRIESD